MDPRTAQIGPSAEPSVDDLAWQLFGSRVGDQHAMLIWVDAVDESDPVQGVRVGTGIVRLEASRRQEKRRLRLVQRDMAFEHIAVKVHRTIQVGLS